MRRRLTILLVLCLCVPVIADETWYVDTATDGTGDDGTAGAPYDTLAQFVAGKAGSMTGRGKVICYLSGSVNDTAAVDLAGFTNTSATDHLELIVSDPWQGAFDDSKYYLRSTSGYSQAINNPVPYTVIRGLQISMPDGNSYGLLGKAHVFIDRCLLVSCGKYAIYLTESGVVINNCLIEASGSHAIAGGYSATIYNTTITGSGGRGFSCDGYITWNLYNCVSAGNTGDDYYRNNATLNLTSCYSEDGTQSTSTITYDTDTFTNISTGTSADRRLVTGSGLIGTGADLSSYTSDSAPTVVDVEGDDRPQNTTWDVGYDEFADEETLIYATSPSPADDPTHEHPQNRAVKLSWTDDATASGNKVYGGTNPASLSLLRDTNTQEWYVVKNLSPGVYYWRVDEIDAESNVTTGTTWEFTVVGKVGVR